MKICLDSPASPLQKGERIACRAVARRRREVRGFNMRPGQKLTLTLLSPL